MAPACASECEIRGRWASTAVCEDKIEQFICIHRFTRTKVLGNSLNVFKFFAQHRNVSNIHFLCSSVAMQNSMRRGIVQ